MSMINGITISSGLAGVEMKKKTAATRFKETEIVIKKEEER